MSEPIRGGLRLTNRVGIDISIAFDTVDHAFDLMRIMGGQGWVSGPIPPGGFELPYVMAETFDFRLIGARAFTMKDGDAEVECLERDGDVYKKRVLPATAKIKNAKIKYSRGARPTDDPAIVESADSGGVGKGYVTLINFVGNGPSIRRFEKPRASDERLAETKQTRDPAPAAAAAPAATPAAAPAAAASPAAAQPARVDPPAQAATATTRQVKHPTSFVDNDAKAAYFKMLDVTRELGLSLEEFSHVKRHVVGDERFANLSASIYDSIIFELRAFHANGRVRGAA